MTSEKFIADTINKIWKDRLRTWIETSKLPESAETILLRIQREMQRILENE